VYDVDDSRDATSLHLFTGGSIDHDHHYNNAYRALVETLALEAALLAALPLVDLADTLLVLTADHSHVMTLGGLATPRGNPILGTVFIYNFTNYESLFTG
jgi:alkaline phosphatase